MKSVKALRELDNEKMQERLAEVKLGLAKERAASEIGTVKNPGRIRSLRRAIARINTIAAERTKTKHIKTKAAPSKAGSEKKNE